MNDSADKIRAYIEIVLEEVGTVYVRHHRSDGSALLVLTRKDRYELKDGVLHAWPSSGKWVIPCADIYMLFDPVTEDSLVIREVEPDAEPEKTEPFVFEEPGRPDKVYPALRVIQGGAQ